jgi:AcrR family transcriptional regulator
MSTQTRREMEKQARIESIKNSAWKVFLKDGLHKSKIAEIAEGCSLGLSTLYYYFKDKRQLVYAVMLDYKMEKHREHLELMGLEISKREFLRKYLGSYLEQIDRFRFFVLADSYYNYHGEYDLSDPVIQEYDKITHENGYYILNSLARGLSEDEWKKIQVAHSMAIGFLRRYVLLPEISLPPTREARQDMIDSFIEMSLGTFSEAGMDLDSEIIQ